MEFRHAGGWMAMEGWAWDGEGPEDVEGRFVKPDEPSALRLTIAGAEEYLREREEPGDEPGG